MTKDKLKYFEYFVHKLYDAYGNGNENDLSTLKLMKLLFFTTAINSKKGSDNILLTKVFDNFVAMPYGHVESTLYDNLRDDNNRLEFYKVDRNKTIRNSDFNLVAFKEFVSKLEVEIVDEIDNSLGLLFLKNSKLIKERVFNLVELSHQWYSWKKNYNEAQATGVYSKAIPPDDIVKEDKFFLLQIF